jgi:hypothetical protein
VPISVPVRHCGFSMARTLFEIYFGMLMFEKMKGKE